MKSLPNLERVKYRKDLLKLPLKGGLDRFVTLDGREVPYTDRNERRRGQHNSQHEHQHAWALGPASN
jgi:hypothetical protein